MGTIKEYLPMFIVVVLAVIAAAYISGKLKLNSYEEYYEENYDGYQDAPLSYIVEGV